MTDCCFVTARLATGGCIHSRAEAQALNGLGITHIVNTQAEFDDAIFLAGLGFGYLYNPTDDDGKAKDMAWFARTLNFVLPALAIPHCKVYIHCGAGINRGPSSAYAVLRALGLSPAIAEQLIRAGRPQVGLAYKRDADLAVRSLGYE
jgi:hypothetical protein